MAVTDISQDAHIAPSVHRIRPISLITTGAAVGAAVFTGTLFLLWRDIPLLGVPDGSFIFHAKGALKSAAHALSPSAFISDSAEYQKALALIEEKGGMWKIHLRLACASVLSALPIGLLAKSYLTPKDALRHIRGGMRFEGKNAVRALNQKLQALAKKQPDHCIAPGVVYPSSSWTKHVLVVGGVGSGKSTMLRPLINSIISNNEKLILFDPKGEFTASFQKPLLLAPWDERSYAWDIAADMRNIGDMRRFASAIIKEGQDPMWANAARQVLVGLMLFLKDAYGSLWGFKELAQMIVIPQDQILQLMQRYNEEAIRAFERLSVTTTGILINLSAFCSAIFDLSSAWGEVPTNRRISIKQWLFDQNPAHRQIILQGHGAYPELTKAYVEGTVGVLSALVNSVEMDDDEMRKIWFIADEFAQMGAAPIRPLFEVGRSRGVRCIVATQDFAQLEALHGKEFTKALVSMCGTTIIGQVGQGETSKILSEYIGTRDVERENLATSFGGSGPSGGKSTTISYNRDELALYKPTELATRLGVTPKNTGVRLVLCTMGNAYELEYPFFSMPKQRKAHIPAKWTLGLKLKVHEEANSASNVTPKGAAVPNLVKEDLAQEENSPWSTEFEKALHEEQEQYFQDLYVQSAAQLMDEPQTTESSIPEALSLDVQNSDGQAGTNEQFAPINQGAPSGSELPSLQETFSAPIPSVSSTEKLLETLPDLPSLVPDELLLSSVLLESIEQMSASPKRRVTQKVTTSGKTKIKKNKEAQR